MQSTTISIGMAAEAEWIGVNVQDKHLTKRDLLTYYNQFFANNLIWCTNERTVAQPTIAFQLIAFSCI